MGGFYSRTSTIYHSVWDREEGAVLHFVGSHGRLIPSFRRGWCSIVSCMDGMTFRTFHGSIAPTWAQ